MENYVTALTFGIFMLSKRHFFVWWLINSAGALLFKKRKKRKSDVFLKYFSCYVYSQQDLGRCFIKKNLLQLSLSLCIIYLLCLIHL